MTSIEIKESRVKGWAQTLRANALSILTNIGQPVMQGGGIFRFHMAAAGLGEHLPEENHVYFLNI
ncbi:hypothetical protein [Cloacibacillus porcorum]|uniref:hypothetical protein n=1 Tax=Cloacibacillus porcorum TaxID=1197717 RepID=UPI003F109E27